MRTFALICILLVAVPLISQNEATQVKSVVLKPDGKPIEGACALIRDFPFGQRVCVQRELRGLRIKLKADPHPMVLLR